MTTTEFPPSERYSPDNINDVARRALKAAGIENTGLGDSEATDLEVAVRYADQIQANVPGYAEALQHLGAAMNAETVSGPFTPWRQLVERSVVATVRHLAK